MPALLTPHPSNPIFQRLAHFHFPPTHLHHFSPSTNSQNPTPQTPSHIERLPTELILELISSLPPSNALSLHYTCRRLSHTSSLNINTHFQLCHKAERRHRIKRHIVTRRWNHLPAMHISNKTNGIKKLAHLPVHARALPSASQSRKLSAAPATAATIPPSSPPTPAHKNLRRVSI